MSNEAIAILLFVAGAALMTLEVFLPAHGVLGILGLAGIVGGIVACFAVAPWVGYTAVFGCVVASPFAAALAMWAWPRTPIGRRMVLQPVDSPVVRPPVAVGQDGVAVSELRPMGTVEIDDRRVEARSEIGIIPAGSRVRVVSFENNRPCVRAVAPSRGDGT